MHVDAPIQVSACAVRTRLPNEATRSDLMLCLTENVRMESGEVHSERAGNKKLFLEIIVERNNGKFSTTWYSKSTDTGLISSRASAPKLYKRNITGSLSHQQLYELEQLPRFTGFSGEHVCEEPAQHHITTGKQSEKRQETGN